MTRPYIFFLKNTTAASDHVLGCLLHVGRDVVDGGLEDAFDRLGGVEGRAPVEADVPPPPLARARPQRGWGTHRTAD
jgi:hypothetical protein